MRIGVICSRVRPEEKLLFNAIRKSSFDLERIDDREMVFDLSETPCVSEHTKKSYGFLVSQKSAEQISKDAQEPSVLDMEKVPNTNADIILDRSINYSRALYSTKIFNDRGIPTINMYDVIKTCGDKILTSIALEKNKIPTVKVRVAFSEESALKAIKEMGFPVVLKPSVGSWGRLLSKVSDESAAETVLEHKKILGTYHHAVFYINEYIEKPGRDIRAFVIGDKTICAIYRSSKHWITNTARGGVASKCLVTSELNELCLKAAKAVGGGVLALDVFETKEGLIVNEINHTMEFRNSIKPTGVDIPKKIIEYVAEQARR